MNFRSRCCPGRNDFGSAPWQQRGPEATREDRSEMVYLRYRSNHSAEGRRRRLHGLWVASAIPFGCGLELCYAWHPSPEIGRLSSESCFFRRSLGHVLCFRPKEQGNPHPESSWVFRDFVTLASEMAFGLSCPRLLRFSFRVAGAQTDPFSFAEPPGPRLLLTQLPS